MFRRGRVPIQLFFALAVAVTGLSYAVAQNAEGEKDTERASDTTVDVVRVDQYGGRAAGQESLGSQVTRAEAIREKAQAFVDAQRHNVEQANKDKDIIRITCVNDKLIQSEALMQNLAGRIESLKAAQDTSQRNHEMTVIEVLNQKFQSLRQDAAQCIGQDIFDTGETSVRPYIDPYSPDENAAVPPAIPEWPIPYIPPPVSGTS